MAPAKVSVKISVATISSDKVNPSFRVRQVFDLDTAISLSLEIKNLLPFRTIGGVSFSNICMIQGTHETHAFVRGNWLSCTIQCRTLPRRFANGESSDVRSTQIGIPTERNERRNRGPDFQLRWNVGIVLPLLRSSARPSVGLELRRSPAYGGGAPPF